MAFFVVRRDRIPKGERSILHSTGKNKKYDLRVGGLEPDVIRHRAEITFTKVLGSSGLGWLEHCGYLCTALGLRHTLRGRGGVPRRRRRRVRHFDGGRLGRVLRYGCRASLVLREIA